jgi:NAD(P)-dependent dehydrogenase (short-subunit alcohol dehydrogenase family)
MDLKDKVVVITGSSSGIGATTALAFAKEGARVVVNSAVNTKGGEEVVAKIKKQGGDAIYVQADISDPKQVKKLFSEVKKKFKTVDILINNAAIPNDKAPYLEASYDEILELVNTDLIAPMMCAKEALKFMQEQGYGKILNTSSIRGSEHGGRSIVYAAS